jgi:hypothetical protein
VLFILLMIWLLPKLWRAIKKVFGWLARLFSAGGKPAAAQAEGADEGGKRGT